MAISIGVKSKTGINVNVGADNYLDAVPSTFAPNENNFGYFYKTMTNAEVYGIAETKEGPQFIDGAALLAKGLLSYDITTHHLTGKLDAISFGDDLDNVTGTFGVSSTKMTLASTDVSFSGLNLDSDKGDDVHGILYGLMTGDAEEFLSLLEKTAVRFTGGKGDDQYEAGVKDDIVNGAGGNDLLYGGGGSDALDGGAGIDRLYGGAGADAFVFKTGGSGKTQGTADTIYDFTKADDIDLTGWDANSKVKGMQDFTFIGTDAFTKHAGELHYIKAASDTWIEGDTNGDGRADFTIHLDDALTLKASHFDL